MFKEEVILFSDSYQATPRENRPQIDLSVKLICKECRDSNPQIIEDFKNGDLICMTCGMILGNKIIDTRSEWRNFSSSDESGGADPNRVGAAQDPLLGNQGTLASTMISGLDSGNNMSKDLSKVHNRVTQSRGQVQIESAFKDITIMCERIGLSKIVIDTAKQLFKKVDDEKILKGKTQETVIASCIYLACREQNVTRTFKEIYALTKVSKKDIGKFVTILYSNRCFKAIEKLLSNPIQTRSLDSMISRFSSFMDLSNEVQKNCLKVTRRVSDLGILSGKSPISIVAACMYLSISVSGHPKSSKEIADVAGCTESTLKNAYKVLYEKLDEWVNDELNLNISIIPTP